MRKFRLNVIAAPTNDIAPRLRAVESIFGKRNGALIDGVNCPNLVRAISHYYRYKRRKTGDLEDKPEKRHPWSDLADCYQYAACSIDGGSEMRAAMYERAMDPRYRTPEPSARGWT